MANGQNNKRLNLLPSAGHLSMKEQLSKPSQWSLDYSDEEGATYMRWQCRIKCIGQCATNLFVVVHVVVAVVDAVALAESVSCCVVVVVFNQKKSMINASQMGSNQLVLVEDKPILKIQVGQ